MYISIINRGRNLLLIFNIKIFIIIIFNRAKGGVYIKYTIKKISKALIKNIKLITLYFKI